MREITDFVGNFMLFMQCLAAIIMLVSNYMPKHPLDEVS